MIDLILHAADEATAIAWFEVRGLYGVDAVLDEEGEVVTPAQPKTDFQYAKYGSGLVYSVAPTIVDGEVTAAGTLINGVFLACRFPTDVHIDRYLIDNSADGNLVTGLSSITVDGLHFIRLPDFETYLQTRGLPLHTWLGGATYVDPALIVQGFDELWRDFGDDFGDDFV